MSLNAITVDIVRETVAEDAGGGETTSPNVIHAGLSVTISYPDKDSVTSEEAAQRTGPGSFTRSDRVVFLDPWGGSVLVQVNDLVQPNPPVGWLPAEMKVIGVRGYEDGAAGELQLDVEDVN